MNKQLKPERSLLHFMLRAQQIAQQEGRSEQGYAMVVVSIVTIVMFSLLAASMALTNLAKSRTNAFVAGTGTFYAAESGLNRRAQAVRSSFLGYARPTGTSPANQIQSCLTGSGNQGSGDFACENFQFTTTSTNGNLLFASTAGATTATELNQPQTYSSFTFVTENPQNPIIDTIPQADFLGGMRMQEYRYQVSSAASVLNAYNSNGTFLNTNINNSAQTVLQMTFKARLVPLFQFAAFYDGDLEILPGAAMTLSGPVHSNGSLYLGGSPTLTLQSNVTSLGSIYNRRKNDPTITYPNGSTRVTNLAGTATTNLLAAASPANQPTTAALTLSNLTAIFGNQVKSSTNSITVPQVGFLGNTDTQQSDGIGVYYGKADLRIQYQPNKTIPLAVTTIKTGVAGADSSTCAGFNISSNRNNGNQLVCAQLTNTQLWSLIQPVLVKATTANERALAPTGQTPATAPTLAQQNAAIELQKAIVKSTAILAFSNINTALTAANLAGLSSTEQALHVGKNPQQVANQAGYFYLPAPIQIYNTFRNNREARNITMLQTNIQSLAFWNRDNVVVDAAGNDTSQDRVLFNRIDTPLATGSKYATVCNGAVGDPRNRSLQCLGLAASDTSEGGMVLHATVDTSVFDAPNAATTYPAGQSPYGFAFVGGSNLPGPLTIASNQAVYVQGDYNYYGGTSAASTTNPNNTNPTNAFNIANNIPGSSGLKEPASVLSDSLNVLSNACRNNTINILNCGVVATSATTPVANPTSMNVAFLSGTDVTAPGNYNGGLENYPRFTERWSGITLLYRGSFISLSSPQNVSGSWTNQTYNAPARNWNYDLAFNDANNLPPLTPQLFYLRQDVFSRK